MHKAHVYTLEEIWQLKLPIDANDLGRVKNLMTRNPELQSFERSLERSGIHDANVSSTIAPLDRDLGSGSSIRRPQSSPGAGAGGRKRPVARSRNRAQPDAVRRRYDNFSASADHDGPGRGRRHRARKRPSVLLSELPR